VDNDQDSTPPPPTTDPTPPNLSPTEAREIDQACDRFEAAWKSGRRPDPAEFLGPASRSVRSALLRHLLLLDWEYRLRAGDRPHTAEYAARFPGDPALIEAVAREAAAPIDPTGPMPGWPRGTTGADGPAPARLGEYRILGEVGRGGMGVVYEAVQESLGRRVALKVLPRTGPSDPTRRERFRREAQLTARLHHPNIVQVFEVGEHEGQPFLALEFVTGPSLAGRLRGTPQPPHPSAALVETLARAIHHAHEHGVVHRDLKPSNILLRKSGSRPDSWADRKPEGGAPEAGFAIADCEPKVTDFGLAQSVAGDDLTASGLVVGTPAYMAPEQAMGKGRRPVGPPADTYALGAVLYECLTGGPPFRGPTPVDTLMLVVSEEPVPPTRLQPRVPRDLETICLKCLEKDPARRYASAAALAEDLRRFRAGESIAARPAGRVERAVKWARRRPATAGLVGVIVAAVAIVLGVVTAFSAVLYGQNRDLASSLESQRQAEQTAELKAGEALAAARTAADRETDAVQSRKAADAQKKNAEEAADLARKQRDEARSHLFTAQLLRVATVYESDPKRALELLHDYEICPIDKRDAAWRYYENACRGQKPVLLDSGASDTPDSPDAWAALSPDGTALALGGGKQGVEVWDTTTGEKRRASLKVAPGSVSYAALSHGGKVLATGSPDGTVRLWDVDTGDERAVLNADLRVVCLAVSPDGGTLAVGVWSLGKPGDLWGEVKLWDVAAGRVRATLCKGYAYSLSFSPDGRTLVSSVSDGPVRLWDVATAQERAAIPRGTAAGVVLGPDGKTLAMCGSGGLVRLWDMDTGRDRSITTESGTLIDQAAFSPDGKTLAVSVGRFGGQRAREVRLLDVATGRERAVIPGLVDGPIDFTPDGHTLVCAGWGRPARLWPMAPPQPHATFRGSPGQSAFSSVAFSPDGKTLATVTFRGLVRLLDAATCRERAPFAGPEPESRGSTKSVVFSPDGKTVATSGQGVPVRLWDADTGRERLVLKGVGPQRNVAFSPDGKTLATNGPVAGANPGEGQTKDVKLWDVATGRERATLSHSRWVWCVAFSPDGRTLASGGSGGTVWLWDVETGRVRAALTGHSPAIVASLAFSPDGKTLASAVNRSALEPADLKLWDADTGRERATLTGHTASVDCVAFSPDGKTLASAGARDPVRFWDVATGRERATLKTHTDGFAYGVTFSPDGKTLAVVGESVGAPSNLTLWDVTRIIGPPAPGGGPLTVSPKSPPDLVPIWRNGVVHGRPGRGGAGLGR
jgi:WD40 repeat protein